MLEYSDIDYFEVVCHIAPQVHDEASFARRALCRFAHTKPTFDKLMKKTQTVEAERAAKIRDHMLSEKEGSVYFASRDLGDLVSELADALALRVGADINTIDPLTCSTTPRQLVVHHSSRPTHSSSPPSCSSRIENGAATGALVTPSKTRSAGGQRGLGNEDDRAIVVGGEGDGERRRGQKGRKVQENTESNAPVGLVQARGSSRRTSAVCGNSRSKVEGRGLGMEGGVESRRGVRKKTVTMPRRTMEERTQTILAVVRKGFL